MHIVIATYGTMGDIQPLLGLAVGLRNRGHATKFAAPPNFARRVTSLGLEFVPLGPAMDMVELRDVYGRACLSSDPVRHVQSTLPLVIRDAPQMITELSAACRNADMLISLPYQLAGRIVHDLLHVPLVSVHLSPFGGYSKRFASETSRQINKLRACYGLTELKDPLGPEGSSSRLTLYAVSPSLFLRPRQWPEQHKVVGYFFLDEAYRPDPSLIRFIDSGEPPVVLSLGSMLHGSPETLGKVVLDALRQLGTRTIVQRGWTGLCVNAPADLIHPIDFVPHSWLFPRAACVVHAGGAGTAAAAARFGIPAVIVPHMLDQFVWATLFKERGSAADAIPYTELTAKRLKEGIKRALCPDSRARAADLAARISNEDGVSLAVDSIEACFQPN
jgi:sterol 3beta-glucosyltransferase